MKTIKGLTHFRLAGILLVVIVLILSGCAKKSDPSINKDFMDLSIKPGDDFYRYANGNWIKNNQIPDDRSSYGSFDIVSKETDQNIRTLLEEVAKKTDAEKGSITQKIRDFYSTGMDTAKIEEEGIKPLQAELNLIESIKTKEEFQDVVARFHTFGLDPLFNGGIEQDLINKNYLVNLKAGEYNDRFFLNLHSVPTEIPDIKQDNDLFSVYTSYGVVKAFINTDKIGPGTLSIINVTGKVMLVRSISESGYIEFNPGILDGIYIITFTSGNYRISKKVFIQNR